MAWRSSADREEKAEMMFWLKAVGSPDLLALWKPASRVAPLRAWSTERAARVSSAVNWPSLSSTMAERARLEKPDMSIYWPRLVLRLKVGALPLALASA